ncbi:MAG TPA: hypothetical protein DCS66_18650 [Flavobacteriaceae bacterium]|nr:hypothetical protein [Flavobacteriaceae bacterium]
MGGILIKIINTQGISFKIILNFWKRRWFRTLPNYFLILIVLLVIGAFFTEGFTIEDKYKYFIFTQNLVTEHPKFFGEAWSLSIEEWFYLLLPIILYAGTRILRLSVNKSLLVTAAGIIVCVTLFRYYRYINLEINSKYVWDKMLRRQVFTQLDSLMFGVIGAYVFYFFKSYWLKFKKAFLVLGILLFLVVRYNWLKFEPQGLFYCVFSFTGNSLATLFLLPYLSTLKSGRGIIYKVVTYISLISYSIYLINSNLMRWIINSINWAPIEQFNGYAFLLTRYFVFWFLTMLISLLLYKYFELPMMNLRDKKSWSTAKFFKSR